MRLIKQNEIQKQGGLCARFPVSCLILDMLKEVGLIKPFRQINVLDLTFGEGRFWAAIPQARVWGFDVRALNHVRKPYVFFKESCENWYIRVRHKEFDLVVVDPPFTTWERGDEKRRHYYSVDSIPIIFREGKRAAEYFNAPLLIHFMWVTYPPGWKVITERAFVGYGIKQPTWFGIVTR